MKDLRLVMAVLMMSVLAAGCSKEEVDEGAPPDPNPYAELIFEFTHNVNGADLEVGTVKYENASTNFYGVGSLQYLIGMIRLKSWENQDHTYFDEHHLVDLSDPSTLTFKVKDSIKIYDYSEVTLFMGFGADSLNNVSGLHSDLDNSNWQFPSTVDGILTGGGYYTLKMAGDYRSNAASSTILQYSIGIGGRKRVEKPSDTSYYSNPIYATLQPNSTNEGGFSIPKGTKVVKIEIRCDLNKLFKTKGGTPNYNLDVHQSNIEGDAIGTATMSDNIANCFMLGSVTFDDEATQ